MLQREELTTTLSRHLPAALRWGGAIARRLRHFNIALQGKSSGSSNTDALTLADLTVQELLVSALRDADPIFRSCRIEAEETTGDLHRFSKESPFTIALDPIDGTKQYRDKTGNGYSIILTLRHHQEVVYSLVFIPEQGEHGTWVEALGSSVRCGEDDPTIPAHEHIAKLTQVTGSVALQSKKIYMIGFLDQQLERASLVTQAGLMGVPADDCPGCIYDLIARGEYAGSLIHTPNVYDFPASFQISRILGGDSVRVHDGERVNFKELWFDDRANMLRLPGIVATSPDQTVLKTLCQVAKDWDQRRYAS